MNKTEHTKTTNLNDDPKKILEDLDIGGHFEAHYDALRGWQIATVYKGKSYLVDCVEDKSKVFIYQ